MNEIRRERAAVAVRDGVRRISWGAIAAGTLLTLALQFMLGLLGLGIGLATIDSASKGRFDPNTFASVGGLWTVAVVLIGLFVGAYSAGRLAGSPSRIDAVLHGAVTWATSTLLVVFLLTSGTSAVLGAAFGAIGGSIQGLSQAASAIAPADQTELSDSLRREAERSLRPGTGIAPAATEPAAGEETPQTVAEATPMTSDQDGADALPTLVAGLGEQASSDQREAAVRVISQKAGVSQKVARQRLQQLQRIYDNALREARQAADQAASAVSAASFAAFVALLLGLVVGAIGGLVGRPRH